MKKEHQKELVIAICFFLLGSCLMFPIEKKRKLDKIKHDKKYRADIGHRTDNLKIACPNRIYHQITQPWNTKKPLKQQ